MALIVRRMFADVPQSDAERYLPRVFVSIGTLLGLAGLLGYQLFGTMGIVAGGAAGFVAWLVVSRFRRL